MTKDETGQQEHEVEDHQGRKSECGVSLCRLHGWLALGCSMVLAACSESAPAPRQEKKPRLREVVLVTDGRPEPTRWADALHRERSACSLPGCELLHFSLTPGDAPISLGPDGGVATNLPGATPVLTARGGLGDVEVFGFLSGQPEAFETDRFMADRVQARMRGGAQFFVLSDECAPVLERVILRHGQWWPFLFAAFARPCGDEAPTSKHVLSTVLTEVPRVEVGYVKLEMLFDRNTRALLSASSTVEPWGRPSAQ